MKNNEIEILINTITSLLSDVRSGLIFQKKLNKKQKKILKNVQRNH